MKLLWVFSKCLLADGNDNVDTFLQSLIHMIITLQIMISQMKAKNHGL